MLWIRNIIVMLTVILSVSAQAQAPLALAAPAPKCHSGDNQWTKQEQIVWEHIVQGKEVNLDDYEKTLGNRTSQLRILTASFLEAVLLDPSCKAKITRHGVRIGGARFVDKIDLVNAELQYELWITKSSFEADVNLSGLRSTHVLNFGGSTSLQDFDLSGAQLAGDLLLGNHANWNDLELDSANIRGHLNLDNSIITGTLSMEGIRVGGNLNADDSKFNNVTLEGGHIEGTLSLVKSTIQSELNMERLQIGETFLLRDVTGPSSALMSELTFLSANWGADPITALTNFSSATRGSGLSSHLYAKLAKSYSDAGESTLARKISIEKEGAEFKRSDTWTQLWLYFFWAVAGYGYKLENTLIIIVGFVLIGAIIFKTGASNIKSGTRPKNWLIFSLDSVIPGIHLNKEHDDVAFSGWRQLFLYFLRFLGAVVLVIVLELLKRTIVGSG